MKISKLDILLDSAFYAVYMFLSCLVCMCAEILAVKIAGLIFVLTPFSICVIRAVIYTVGVCAILSIVAYKEGYRAVKVSALGTSISIAIASVVYLLFCMLFNFDAFCAGGVESVAILAKYGETITLENYTATLTRADCIPIFIIHILIYGALTVAFKLLGARNRVLSRAGMVIEETKTNE